MNCIECENNYFLVYPGRCLPYIPSNYALDLSDGYFKTYMDNVFEVNFNTD